MPSPSSNQPQMSKKFIRRNSRKERWRQGGQKTHQEGAREANWSLLSQYSTLEQWSAQISGKISQQHQLTVSTSSSSLKLINMPPIPLITCCCKPCHPSHVYT
uniref:Uncharacterized protein n=1 Tax=Arundo donax TaxID=35708 RepID=A0A0A9CZL4_ARUDO